MFEGLNPLARPSLRLRRVGEINDTTLKREPGAGREPPVREDLSLIGRKKLTKEKTHANERDRLGPRGRVDFGARSGVCARRRSRRRRHGGGAAGGAAASGSSSAPGGSGVSGVGKGGYQSGTGAATANPSDPTSSSDADTRHDGFAKPIL